MQLVSVLASADKEASAPTRALLAGCPWSVLTVTPLAIEIVVPALTRMPLLATSWLTMLYEPPIEAEVPAVNGAEGAARNNGRSLSVTE